jgi:hypothetical protein
VTLTAWRWPEHALPPWNRPQTPHPGRLVLQHPGLSAMKLQPDTQDPLSVVC